jgi:UDP-glucose 4-epimerase
MENELPITNGYLPDDQQSIDSIALDSQETVYREAFGIQKKPVSLVTGGAGFLGSHVAEHLLKMGHKVIVIDNLSGGFKENVPTGAIFHKVDVTNYELLKQIFIDYRPDYVFHLAAYAAEGLSHFIRRFNYTNNLIGSVNLINLSVIFSVRRFIFTSSMAVYGANQTPMREDMIPAPEDPYGISKYAVEMDLAVAHKMWGLNYTIFRPHNVYGENQNYGDKYRNVIGIFINELLQEKPITIFGDGLQTRAFSYIDDVAPYIAKSCVMPECEGQIINIGADKPYTILEIAKELTKWLNPWAGVQHLPAREEVRDAFCDHSKATRIFGEHATTTLEYGISRMIAWVGTKGVMEPQKFKGIEVWKNMPESWRKFTQD